MKRRGLADPRRRLAATPDEASLLGEDHRWLELIVAPRTGDSRAIHRSHTPVRASQHVREDEQVSRLAGQARRDFERRRTATSVGILAVIEHEPAVHGIAGSEHTDQRDVELVVDRTLLRIALHRYHRELECRAA